MSSSGIKNWAMIAGDFGMVTPSHSSSTPYSDTSPATPSSDATSIVSVNYQQDLPVSGDIAVIGLGCRVPGGNNTPAELWQYLMEKKDASGEIPPMRWEPYHRRDPRNPKILSKTTSKGYFLDHLDDFDASFFGISPREAEQMDPQQRISVEVAWEALEDAGISPQSLAGSDTAVFMGVNSDDYARLMLEDLPGVEAWMGVGSAFCGIPNRLSYLLDLMGPSYAVDGACASSLVAIHLARQALLAGETSLVIAGGVNALVGPGLTRVLDQAGAISSDGRCRSFDDTAAGYGRGEGAGIVVLKRMADAVRDQDRILAVLKGSAVAADGRTNGIMAPNSVAQEKVAHQALKAARISPSTVSYVEAHATSTPIGDPAECSAISNVYGSGARTLDDKPCLIGSIKPNIGHLEAGAGVLGFIKAVLAVHKGIIPPQTNLQTLNSKIDWAKSMLKVVQEPTEWPMKREPRRAAICSYGYGGTVSHAVIESAPAQHWSDSSPAKSTNSVAPTLLLLSAPKPSAIAKWAKVLSEWLGSSDHQEPLESVAFTLANKRGHHNYRAAVITDGYSDAVKLLDTFSNGSKSPWISSGRTLLKGINSGAVWVYSGHGAQWSGMGRALMESEPSFSDVLFQLDPIIQEELGFSAIEALQNEDFKTSDKVQALTYVMHIGITEVLKSKGAVPAAVIGHSMGEIAAAVTAGSLSIREGALIACARARVCRAVAGAGAMILVSTTFNEAVEELRGREDVGVAIDSSPTSCVVSGALKAIAEVSAMWKEKGVQVRVIKSDIAFHSPVLLPLAEPLRELLDGHLMPKPPKIPLYSTSLTSDPRGNNTRDMEYWVNNLLKPVLLCSAISAATEDGFRTFLEVSSHPIVTHSIKEILMENEITDGSVIPTMYREKPAQKSILLALGNLHCAGSPIDLKNLLPGRWIHEVPKTQWDHQSYWRNVETASFDKKVSHDVNSHVLLGSCTQLFGTDGLLWETYLDESVKPFPGSHFLHESEIVPAAVLLNTFLAASSSCSLRNVALRVPVMLIPARQVQVLLQHNHIRISSRFLPTAEANQDEQSWLTNTTAQVGQAESSLSVDKVDIVDIKKNLQTSLQPSFSIDYLANVGVRDMGFPWKVVEHIENETQMLAKVDVAPGAGSLLPWAEGSWAPILDAATSVGSTIFHREPELRMPVHIDRVTVRENASIPRISYIYVRKCSIAFTADVFICDESGNTVAEFQSMRFSGIEGTPDASRRVESIVYEMAWPPVQLAESPLPVRQIVFIANESPLLEGYRYTLSRAGIETKTVRGSQDLQDLTENAIVVFIPDEAKSAEEVYTLSSKSCEVLLDTVKALADRPSAPKLFCITKSAAKGIMWTALGHSPLHGLARIIQSEHPELWGGLIDVEHDDLAFPIQATKYAQGADVIRVRDSVARSARLRPLKIAKAPGSRGPPALHIRVEGTYVITGGLGALGLEVAAWMIEKGARRIVLVSRRRLPPRSRWEFETDNPATQQILAFEALGATIHTVSVDMAASDSADHLKEALDRLSLPSVLGVVHAAGVLDNQLVMETTTAAFNQVIAPKIAGAIALNEIFPPKALDFFVLFSSCGQLLGFPGQASYATGNAFLDCLAAQRRTLGDNSLSMMWTSWRGLGMASSTEYINAELAAKGITDITRDEAFQAWDYVSSHDTDHAVVLRVLSVDENEVAPHPILNEVLVRRHRHQDTTSTADAVPEKEDIPTSGPELNKYVTYLVIECVATTLTLDKESVDLHMALSELGMDSVMGVGLRSKLQQVFKTRVTPTLIWNHPTVSHLTKYFAEKLTK